jgi:hypothetical protein
MAALHCTGRLRMQNLHAIGGQSHIILPEWPPVTCNINKIDGNLHAPGGHAVYNFHVHVHATGSHSVTRQEARIQGVCKRPSLHHNYIFFSIGKSTSLTHASDFSADGPWIFGLENALVLWMT